MFSSITWESFLVTVLVLVGGYYCIATLLLYHKEITSFFKQKQTPPSEQEHPTETDEPESNSLIGSISHEESWLNQRSSLVNTEEIVFDEAESTEIPEEIAESGKQDLLTGSVADLMEEIKTLLQLVKECGSNKEECASLFQPLFQRYPHIKNTSYQAAINRHICEESKSQFSFNIEPLDVRSWWEE